mgnify:CR=1 FL=1
MEKKYIDILTPDDWHVHLREGEMLSCVLPFTYKNFSTALVMPNLDKPVTNITQADTYQYVISVNNTTTCEIANGTFTIELDKISNYFIIILFSKFWPQFLFKKDFRISKLP